MTGQTSRRCQTCHGIVSGSGARATCDACHERGVAVYNGQAACSHPTTTLVDSNFDPAEFVPVERHRCDSCGGDVFFRNDKRVFPR